jgi:hypothetical protein
MNQIARGSASYEVGGGGDRGERSMRPVRVRAEEPIAESPGEISVGGGGGGGRR